MSCQYPDPWFIVQGKKAWDDSNEGFVAVRLATSGSALHAALFGAAVYYADV